MTTPHDGPDVPDTPDEPTLTSPYLAGERDEGEEPGEPTQAMPAVSDDGDAHLAQPPAAPSESAGEEPGGEEPAGEAPEEPAPAASPERLRRAATPATATAGTEAQPEPDAQPAPAPRRRGRALRRTVRIVAGIGAIALVAGITLGARWLDEPTEQSVAPLEVAVPASEIALVCPGSFGSLTATGSDSELSGASAITGQVAAVVLAREGELAPATLGALGEAGAPLAEGSDAAVLTAGLAPQASVLRAQPGSSAAWALAASVQRADDGDLRGLAAVSCPAATSTSWFAAGRTTLEASAVLALRNPGATPATVTLRAWGPTGPITLQGAPVVVAPGAEVTQVLEGLVPDVERLVLAVTASGGQVAATLQTSQLNGLTPNGVDVVGPTVAPATEVLIPGVALAASTVDEDDTGLVRVFNPGEEPARITVELVGEQSTLPLVPGGLVVEPGAVADISLAGAPEGTYSVRVTSDSPVVAGASVVRAGAPAPQDPDIPVVDRAWLSAVAPATESGLALPGLGEAVTQARLVIANPAGGAATVEVTGYGADGAEVATTSVTVSSGRSVTLDVGQELPGAVAILISGATPVSAAAVLTATDALGEQISVVGALPDPQVERSAAIRISQD